MSFLQPAILFALPVIALPIIIHLINQRRFQTVEWAAMQFLLAANRMSKGYARLRQFLILAARTLAVAGLVFAISRPLSSGWLGLAGGGRVDTTIILLDRSPSMLQSGPGGVSKLQSGVEQLVMSLRMLRSNRYVLIDSANTKPIELDTPDQLLDMPETIAVSQSADVPAMLEVVDEYIRANQPSRCEVWICSDVRKNDWQDDSGRWDAIRKSLVDLPQMVRYHLLAYPDVAEKNRSIRVTNVRRVESTEGPRLLLSLSIFQSGPAGGRVPIPVQLELDGARSEFTVEMNGNLLELQDHAVPLDGGESRGWGRVSLASDANPSDNECFFVYDTAVERRTLIVANDTESIRPLALASAVSPDPEIVCSSEVLSPDQLIAASLDDVALLLWQAPIPQASDPVRAMIEAMLERGGQAIFFPPQSPTGEEFAGLRWTEWSEVESLPVATWVSDQDLLAKTRSGASLPVGELKVQRHCGLSGDRTALATLDGGSTLLARAMTDQRNVYFCATTTSAEASSLAPSGIVLYAMIQRALAIGAESLGNTRQFLAGEVPFENSNDWQRLAGNPNALSNSYAKHAGIYEMDPQLFAINRSATEDETSIVPPMRVEALFRDLDFDRVDDSAGSGSSLIQEIWRLFLVAMMVALLLEAALCLPRRIAAASARSAGSSSGASGNGSFPTTGSFSEAKSLPAASSFSETGAGV